MKRNLILLVALLSLLATFAFRHKDEEMAYSNHYSDLLEKFRLQQIALMDCIEKTDVSNDAGREKIKAQIAKSRDEMKGLDFWLRYLEPVAYKKINGPLPVEWETEAFEKFEKPYKREGAGLTLAALYLDEEEVNKEYLYELVKQSISAIETYQADSITYNLKDYDHFYLCNRLYLLNLAAIYTTGFECPDTAGIIPELNSMMSSVQQHYRVFNESFPDKALSGDFMERYQKAIVFVKSQSSDYSSFDHFTFIRDYVNPLFTMNQQMIREYTVISKSFVDYALNKDNTSIFSKSLYNSQNAKGIFLRVTDELVLSEISELGKLLFYDPILSGNNQRSCASCHKPAEFFTDTVSRTSIGFNHLDPLARNTPSLLNAGANHLIMLDGKHISLQNQTKDVITNKLEMGGEEKEILRKILSCKTYKKAFSKLLKHTPQEQEITFHHITSAITIYYSKFSSYDSPFDEAMNKHQSADANIKTGFNLFMSKAQCATCHFVPQFNGIKPPYVSSEFEVLGVPADTGFKLLSPDKGRFEINPAVETMNAFRTGSIRNAECTKPYMHNGVFCSLNEVIDFYNLGGGAGRGLRVDNQTLSSDSLGLSNSDKLHLIAFIHSLNENIPFEKPPEKLPESSDRSLNKRKVGGLY